MAEGHTDYSGTPLWKKLGIRQGSRLLVVGAPDDFEPALIAIAPVPPGVRRLARATNHIDVAVLFTTTRRTLGRRFPALQRALDPAGRLWVAWPTQASRVETDLTFAIVQAHGLDAGLVDNKTASITDVFQGCQFVVRVRNRPPRTGRGDRAPRG